MIPLLILTGAGTLTSLVLAFMYEACPFCDLLRAISFGSVVAAYACRRNADRRLHGLLFSLLSAGTLLSGYLHLTAGGWAGCPVDCKAVELLGFDLRTISFAYFSIALLTLLHAWGRPRREFVGMATAAAAFLILPLLLVSQQRSGTIADVEGAFLFMNPRCPKCKELLANEDNAVSELPLEVILMGDKDVRQQVYSATDQPLKLMAAYSKSNQTDLYEFAKRFTPADIDVRRGDLLAKRAAVLSSQFDVPNVPALAVSRRGRYIVSDSRELMRDGLKKTLQSLMERSSPSRPVPGTP